MAQAYVTVSKSRALRAAEKFARLVNENPNMPDGHKASVLAMANAIRVSDSETVLIEADSPLAMHLDNVVEQKTICG